MQLMATDRRVASAVLELFRLRDRPQKAPGNVAVQQMTSHGEQVVILKDLARHRYFRLSGDGWQLWQRLDGEHSVYDLMIQQLRATRKFTPQALIDLLQRLAAAGFIRSARLAETDLADRPAWWLVVAAWLTRAFTWKVQLTGCDGWVSRLYAGGARVLFTRPALVLFSAVAVGRF